MINTQNTDAFMKVANNSFLMQNCDNGNKIFFISPKELVVFSGSNSLLGMFSISDNRDWVFVGDLSKEIDLRLELLMVMTQEFEILLQQKFLAHALKYKQMFYNEAKS